MRFRTLGTAIAVVFSITVLAACNPEVMQSDLERTYNARQCIIDRESRNAGVYTAENPVSTASGAYQWLDSSWRTYLPWAEKAYNVTLVSPEEEARGARQHAAYASPYAQDVVASYALVYKPQNLRPWPYTKCWALVGTDKSLRLDGPESIPPPFIQAQIDVYAYGKSRS